MLVVGLLHRMCGSDAPDRNMVEDTKKDQGGVVQEEGAGEWDKKLVQVSEPLLRLAMLQCNSHTVMRINIYSYFFV